MSAHIIRHGKYWIKQEDIAHIILHRIILNQTRGYCAYYSAPDNIESHMKKVLSSQQAHNVETTSIQRWFNVKTLNQRCFNAVCLSVEIVYQWNQPSGHTTLKQRWFNVLTLNQRSFNAVCPNVDQHWGTQRWNNVDSTSINIEAHSVETTLIQRQAVESTLFQHCVSTGLISLVDYVLRLRLLLNIFLYTFCN